MGVSPSAISPFKRWSIRRPRVSACQRAPRSFFGRRPHDGYYLTAWLSLAEVFFDDLGASLQSGRGSANVIQLRSR